MSVCREMSIFVHFWWIILHLHTTIDTVRGLAVSKQCAQQAKSVLISVNVCRKTWCLTSTETIRFIRDGTTPPPFPRLFEVIFVSLTTGAQLWLDARLDLCRHQCQFSLVQFRQFKMVAMRSEKPYALHPVSLRRFSSVAFETVPLFVCLTMSVGSVSVQYDDGCRLSVSAVWRWLLAQCQCSMTIAVGSVSVQYDDVC